jgi:integrase
MARKSLTTKYIESPKRAPPAGTKDYPDPQVPGLAVRVTSTGYRAWVLVARYPLHPKNPTRRVICRYGAMTRDDVHAKARAWLKLIERGIDPEVQAAKERAAAQRRQGNTWGNVVADYLDQHCKGLKKAGEAKHVLETELGKQWGARPITDITGLEVSGAIRAIVERGAPAQARNAFGWVAGLFSWAAGVGIYGVEASPTALLKPSKLIGPKVPRDRVLTDAELRAVWKSADTMAYPFGTAAKLLMLTGARKLEIGNMSWSEVDLDKRIFTLPPERSKTGVAHVVPLSDSAYAILADLDKMRRNPPKPERAGNGSVATLPRWDEGSSIFSTTGGAKPLGGWSKYKTRLDKACGVTGWVLHDIRRSMRTNLSALPVPDDVREAVIGHLPAGIRRAYDLYSRLDEKRHCLDLWDKRLATILNPPPPGVTQIADARAKRKKRT